MVSTAKGNVQKVLGEAPLNKAKTILSGVIGETGGAQRHLNIAKHQSRQQPHSELRKSKNISRE